MSISLKKERGDRQHKSYLVSSVIFSILFLSFITFSSASTFGYNYLDNRDYIIDGANYSINVNNTEFLRGLTPQQVANLKDTSSLVPYTGASSNVDLGSNDITTTGSGFISYLGSLLSRVTKLWATDINTITINISGLYIYQNTTSGDYIIE